MQKIKEILRLSFEAKLSQRRISACLKVSTGVISKYLTRANDAGLNWPLPEDMDEAQFMSIMQPPKTPAVRVSTASTPDWLEVQKELKNKAMTLQLLWEEYAEQNPGNHYSYPTYCRRFRAWTGKQKLSMRQVHLAGEKLFVDYCGPTVGVINPETGVIRYAQIFVAVMGASSYTYAEATWSQALPDWIGSHVRTFEFLGGVPELVIPDNLRSAVSKASRYDPVLNPTYQQLADHYKVAVMPARPYKPKDKSKAEVGVQIVERWILMRLRKQEFFTLASLNQAIQFLLEDLNRRPFKARPSDRLEQFEKLDRPALRPLPCTAYEYTELKKARVHMDYHVEYERHYYSVPYQLVKQEVMLHVSKNTIKIVYQSKQVAMHARSYNKGTHTTDPGHMAKAHQRYAEWNPSRILKWAESIGPHTMTLIQHQLESKPHPEQGYRACLGLLGKAKKVGDARIEAACHRAIEIKSLYCKTVINILDNGLDQLPLENSSKQSTLPFEHENVRGADYYQ